MADNQPIRNPFPYLATMTLAGRRFSNGVPDLGDGIRTLERGPILGLRNACEGFVKRFRTGWTNVGEVVALRGPHGSGKTHSIFAAWNSLPVDDRIYPFYVLQQNADFLGVYLQVAHAISFRLAKELSTAMLGAMTVEEFKSVSNTDYANEDISPPSDAQAVQKAFDTYAVEEGAAKARQRAAILDLSRGSNDLYRAMTCLQGDQYASDAYSWLRGEPVIRERLDAMGISDQIRSPQQALSALELLAALFSISGRKLILFLDQTEKLLLDEDLATTANNTGYLRSLMESFISRNAMIVLAGSFEAWTILHQDVRQRVGPNAIDCPVLRLSEAINLIRLYVTPATRPFQFGEGSIYPFDEAAVRVMLSLGSGNMRRFLQLCYSACQAVSSTGAGVDEQLVRFLASTQFAGTFASREQVKDATRKLLRRHRVNFDENRALMGGIYDFVVLNGSSPALLIDVRESVFADDEASNALRSTIGAEHARKHARGAAYLLVAVGYVSPEIQGALESAVDELILHSADRYDEEMNLAIERFSSGVLDGSDSEVTSDLTEVKRLIQELQDVRKYESATISNREKELTRSLEANRFDELSMATMNRWRESRRNLEADIAKVRGERGANEIDQINRETTVNSRRYFGLLAVLGVGALAALVWILVRTIYGRTSLLYGDIRMSEITALALIYGAAVILSAVLPWISEPEMFSKITSISDLVESGTRRKLWAVFPFFRRFPLARVQHGIRQSQRDFGDFMRSEPLAGIRRASCHLLARGAGRSRFRPDGLLEIIAEYPEAGILLDSQEDSGILLQKNSQIPRVADLLLAITLKLDKSSPLLLSLDRIESEQIALKLCLIAGGNWSPKDETADYWLMKAYDDGLDQCPKGRLSNLSALKLREAIEELSPFELNGLGTRDSARAIKRIDEVFIFCHQLQFYGQQGVLAPDIRRAPQSSAP